MAEKLNKKEVAEKLVKKIDWIMKQLTERKDNAGKMKTMLDLLYGIENTIFTIDSLKDELKRLRKDASPLTETEQLLFDAYKDIDSNGFEGGGGLNEEQLKEYNRLCKLIK